MPINVTDVVTYTTPIQSVATGDPANQANFLLAPQGLANRTAFHQSVLTSGDMSIVGTTGVVAALSSASVIPVTTGLGSVTNPATTGLIRAANAITAVAARNAANTQNIPLLATDSSNNVQIGDPSGAQGALTVLNGTTGLSGKVAGVATLSLANAATDFIALGTGSMPTTGAIRFPNASPGITFRNFAGTADLLAISVDTNNSIYFGTLSAGFLANSGLNNVYFYAGAANLMTLNGGSGLIGVTSGGITSTLVSTFAFDSGATLTEWDHKINGTTILSITPTKLVTKKGISRALRRVATSTTLTTADDIVIFSASGQTATLPTSPAVGDKYTIGLDAAGTSNTYAIYTNGVACVYQGGSSVANPAFTITTAGFTGANNTNVVSLTWTGSVWLMADGY